MRTPIAMTWEKYEALGPDARGEYINGALLPMNPPRKIHQLIAPRLIRLIESVVEASYEVVGSWSWKPAELAGAELLRRTE